MTKESLTRTSGVLLHPTSLPSPYGIGNLGKEAYYFVDFLERAGQHLWQVLPLTHTGFGDSPYQSVSAFAGQPLMIDPEHLVELGLLTWDILHTCPYTDPARVDYGAIIPWKQWILKTAYEKFLTLEESELTESYEDFCEEQDDWLSDYALFMALKDAHEGKSWLDWEDEYRKPTAALKKKLSEELKIEAGFYRFIQFIFFTEWAKLKSYANEHGIKIIGDIPIFVSMDSADIWANQELFQLDTKGYPLGVAGVPPDYFSATGQLWGNPLYDWKAHEKEGYAWWISRVEHQLESVDILRLDHFRGFESYWFVPYGEETAVNGEWKKGPGSKLFNAIRRALDGELPIIAEDLGIITEEVEELRDSFGFPGMKILQFAFENMGESTFLPHNFTTSNCVCYTGTHDNNTTRGWFECISEECRQKTRRYLSMHEYESISYHLAKECLASTAAYAIIPAQDLLNIGSEGRMNCPGAASGNWSWLMYQGALHDDLARELRELSQLYGRF